ncbi:hypothetical protein FSARC_10561 [Fusarium sarcochroum]|uniref:Uncharacterized protein n=1 Tax=Fusarium sarcochroum TaxID=1208366 RepID=A0A8H4TLE9_9HYPO|nr:hypothetical protein FSARC_10561 [Fusarium sarcochroum]
MTLRNILKDVASPVEIEEMISDPHHELWKSQDLSQALESMLKSTYRPYISTIQDMHSCMKMLASHLDIERQAGTADELDAVIMANRAILSPQGRPTFQFRRAIKFTMKKKGIQILLRDMKVCNDRLDEFIAKSDKVSHHVAIDSTSPKPGSITSLQQIQSYATMLHQALSKAWSCSAHSSHDIRLLLEDRIERQRKQKSLRRTKLNTKPPCFTISHRPSLDVFPWQSAKIEIIDSSQVERHTPTAVRFQGLATQSSRDTRGLQSLKAVENFCTSFHPHSTTSPSFGLRLDGNGLLYGTYEIDTESKISSPTSTESSANLLILAKLLLNIKFHGRMRSPYGENDLAQAREFDRVRDSQVLNKWIVQEKGNLSFAHYDAIQFCIVSSNNNDADLWDLRFRQVMLDKVVAPLVDELNYWRGAA